MVQHKVNSITTVAQPTAPLKAIKSIKPILRHKNFHAKLLRRRRGVLKGGLKQVVGGGDQCDRIRRFLKVLVEKNSSKSSPKEW